MSGDNDSEKARPSYALATRVVGAAVLAGGLIALAAVFGSRAEDREIEVLRAQSVPVAGPQTTHTTVRIESADGKIYTCEDGHLAPEEQFCSAFRAGETVAATVRGSRITGLSEGP